MHVAGKALANVLVPLRLAHTFCFLVLLAQMCLLRSLFLLALGLLRSLMGLIARLILLHLTLSLRLLLLSPRE